eukprot:TRINITY_DN1454_c0_g1_i1.p2 TRINITY_DN1454_c0_g1~~TRINITY_DN1454_c0_g1_i1.p2  ORF type:complete len:249 (+),score=20.29 TRINITY_DN1454_c0_g1_i1:985-1731(+)
MVSGKCICGKCKWPISKPVIPINDKTTYHVDYQPQMSYPLEMARPIYQLESEYRPPNVMLEGQSLYQHDYPRPSSPLRPLASDRAYPRTEGRFNGQTTYNTTYTPKRASPEKQISPPLASLRATLPVQFEGRTTYNTEYHSVPIEKASPIRRGSQIKIDAPFSADTSYRIDYVKKDVGPVQRPHPTNFITMTKSLPGQWDSEQKRSYTPKELEPCPAREMLKEMATTNYTVKNVLKTLKQRSQGQSHL